jgi:hypothetical protein
MNHQMNIGTIQHSDLPENDYVSPGLAIIMPDAAFPNMIAGDTSVPRWPYLRRWVEQTWYTDRRNPDAGFVNRDEASILYNSALLFRGKPSLEVGCWRGWSAVHLVLGTGMLDIIDPLLGNSDFADSVTASCQDAGVLDKVTLHAGASPEAVHALAQASGKRWSLIFIDGDHEGDAPRRDAEAARLYAADTAMMLFHDLASPHVAAGLDAMRQAGWHTMIYQTMQIMGVAWRGNVQPVAHVPDPKIFWTLPRHLAGYTVSGWTPPTLPANGAAWPGMSVLDRRNAAMMRAQAAEDDLADAQKKLAVARTRIDVAEATVAERDAALAGYHAVLAERHAAVALREQAIVERDAALAERDQMLAQRAAAQALWEQALTERDGAMARADSVNAGMARLAGQLDELTATITERAEAAALQELAARQQAALHRLVLWVLQGRVLLALLRRSPKQRIAIVRSQAAAEGIAEVVTDRFLHWLCRRRTLLGLLRRSTWYGEAAVHKGLQASEDASPPPAVEASSDVETQPETEAPSDRQVPADVIAARLDRWFATGHATIAAAMRQPMPMLARYFEGLGLSASAIDAAVALLTTECSPAARRTLNESLATELAHNSEFAAQVAGVRGSIAFDEAFYRERAGLDGTDLDPALHYLLLGEPLGLSPSAAFNATYYAHRYPDVIEAGVNCLLHYESSGRGEGRLPLPESVALPKMVAVLQHWFAGSAAEDRKRRELAASSPRLQRYFEQLGFSRAGAAALATALTTEKPSVAELGALIWSEQYNSDLPQKAERVRRCPEFDEALYRERVGLGGTDVDPALHYLLLGEPLGLSPLPAFDAAYYARRYPDVGDAGMNCLLHYDASGRAEGRRALARSSVHTNPALQDRQRENVIVVVHEASRTGAPILGWNIVRLLSQTYNIYTILLGEGPLTPEFEALSVEVHVPFSGMDRHPADLEFGLRRLFAARAFKYAIVNSIESRGLVEICARRSVPTLLLMHEFGSYVQPLDSLQRALDLSTEIVFPAPIVARSTTEVHPPLLDRTVRIQPQGMSIIPSGNTTKKLPPRKQMRMLTEARANGAFIVIGAGTVVIRKGVDLFISIAADLRRLAPARPVHFLWIGHGYLPNQDMSYSVYLKEQLERSDLQDDVTFIDEVSDLDPIYDLAHAFLLTSRLDPLPNVSIDAAYRSIPTICFRDASGTADLLLADPETACGVVPHLDTAAAAALIAHLAADEPARERMGKATGRLARSVFDMQAYVTRLDTLGTATAAVADQSHADAETLRDDDSFDQALFLGPGGLAIKRDEAIAQYLAVAVQRRRGGPNAHAAPLRRPMAGFDPWAWTVAHPSRADEQVDPLADFIRRGRPPGPWLLPVLRPATEAVTSSPDRLRALLHVHLTNPDLAPELLADLRANNSACDLLVTTSGDDEVALVRQALAGYRQGTVMVAALPPCDGDNLQLTLAQLLAASTAYDVVGHIHDRQAKDDGNGRNFHWENLIGRHCAMRDRILMAFSEQPNLGLVFPADPYLGGWKQSRPCAEKLAARLGLNPPMPETFDFPVGHMFWMRTSLLRHLLPLYAAEETAEGDDETAWQEAFVRIVPFAAQAAGLSLAVTNVPGVAR